MEKCTLCKNKIKKDELKIITFLGLFPRPFCKKCALYRFKMKWGYSGFPVSPKTYMNLQLALMILMIPAAFVLIYVLFFLISMPLGVSLLALVLFATLFINPIRLYFLVKRKYIKK
tara:strand:- start:292 stop:639 length:348 start_codon:yes stop_codon:yes gene_type:complete